MPNERMVALSVLGDDRPGLIADISGVVTELGGNIVHVDQSSIYGLFSCFMLIEMGAPLPAGAEVDATSLRQRNASARVTRDIYRFVYDLTRRIQDLQVTARAEVVDPEALPSPDDRDLRVVTILGSDRPGVMRAITRTVADHGANIERMRHVARGDLMAFEITLDVADAEFAGLREALREATGRLGLDAIVQPAGLFRTRKRLVVFDMDRTIVDGEVIDELAKAAGVAGEVSRITERAMGGELDFQESLRARVRMLAGLPVEELERIAEGLELTPGTLDLLSVLKRMGFRLALISGGFTFFTDRLKRELGFDYTFANELVIEDGRLTGEVKEPILDAEGKAKILRELAEREGITPEEVVAIGDGANDRIMIRDAGLGIAFDAREILKRQADGALTRSNLRGLLYALGATEGDLRRFEGR